jgi:regulator of sigma E protease
MLHSIPETLRTPLSFLITLGVLIFVHEMGHYLAARWRGVYVETFSIGFGRAVASWVDRQGTVWKLGWLPLGGYVKMYGLELPMEGAAADPASADPRFAGHAFFEKSVLSRAIIVAAGPVANFLLAIVLFAGLTFAQGKPLPEDKIGPVIGEVVADSAAARAGLHTGDVVTMVDGAPVANFAGFSRIIQAHPNQTLQITVKRDGGEVVLAATPDQDKASAAPRGLLGVGAGVTRTPATLGESITAGFTRTWTLTGETLRGLWGVITGQRSSSELGGPLRIAVIAGQVAGLGIASSIGFIAILSVNLGLLNLFPIPVLDGGHLVFFLLEAIRGRPLPRRALEYGYSAGFVVIAGLMLFSFWNDLNQHVFGWLARLAG